ADFVEHDERNSANTSPSTCGRALTARKGGSGEIRTPGGITLARFQVECNRPLCHASRCGHRNHITADTRMGGSGAVVALVGHELRCSDGVTARSHTVGNRGAAVPTVLVIVTALRKVARMESACGCRLIHMQACWSDEGHRSEDRCGGRSRIVVGRPPGKVR